MLNRKSNTQLVAEETAFLTVAAGAAFGLNEAAKLSAEVSNVVNYTDTHWIGMTPFVGLQLANLARAAYMGATLPKADWASVKNVATRLGVDALAAEAAEAIYLGVNTLCSRDVTEVNDCEKAAVRTFGPGLVRAAGLGLYSLFAKKPATLDAELNADLLDQQEKGEAQALTR
ncbi:MAG: hypothetical protein P4M12_12500 [Gammaproteobacteria bacterium]|nr:hypothetical protein [Gammaproteobacteria bacterium]